MTARIYVLHSRHNEFFPDRENFVKLRRYTYKLTIFLSVHTDKSICGT